MPYASPQLSPQSAQTNSGSSLDNDKVLSKLTSLTQGLQNQVKEMEEVKKQIGQMVEFMGKFKEEGKLTSFTIINPKRGFESAKSITLRSGQEVGTNPQPSKSSQKEDKKLQFEEEEQDNAMARKETTLPQPPTPLKPSTTCVDIEDPVLEVIPAPLSEHSAVPGSKDVIFCERARVSGISRLKLGSYASSLKITLSTSVAIPERLHSKIQVCFHRNNTLGLCQCEEDDWKNIQKGLWSSVLSPYDERYVDVKFIGKIPGSVTITVEEDFQRWRLVCLALGFTLLLLAPIVSNWVPFYYTSSMVIGVFLVIIIILFQGMKLLPTGRKNVLYLTIYGSVLGAGSFLVHQFSLMVNSILLSFGLSEEMHNPVSIFLLVGIILTGAALGYWIVRKFVVSKDGTVDVGIAQFVKWAMRIIGTTSILQSTLDTPLAMGALVNYWIISKLITSLKWHLKSFCIWKVNISSPRKLS
nr:uncharacterized protein LOC103423163 isoform X3 [Malus domestica]